MTAEIIDYRDGDIFKMDMREGDALGSAVAEPPGVKWSLVEGESVLACMGIMNVASGVGMLWMFASDEARGHGVKMAKFGKRTLDFAFNEMRYHRIQTVVRTDLPEYEKWARLFGFENEGLMKKATPSQDDLYLFAKVA